MIYCMLHLTTSTFAKSVEDLVEDRVLGQAAGDLQVDRLRSASPTCAITSARSTVIAEEVVIVSVVVIDLCSPV